MQYRQQNTSCVVKAHVLHYFNMTATWQLEPDIYGLHTNFKLSEADKCHNLQRYFKIFCTYVQWKSQQPVFTYTSVCLIHSDPAGNSLD